MTTEIPGDHVKYSSSTLETPPHNSTCTRAFGKWPSTARWKRAAKIAWEGKLAGPVSHLMLQVGQRLGFAPATTYPLSSLMFHGAMTSPYRHTGGHKVRSTCTEASQCAAAQHMAPGRVCSNSNCLRPRQSIRKTMAFTSQASLPPHTIRWIGQGAMTTEIQP